MPIYDKGYRTFDGTVKRRFRWMTMVRQEWRIMRKRWIFWILLVPTILSTIFFAVYIYVIDIIGSAPNHPWAQAARELPMRQVDNVLIHQFIGWQIPFVFIIAILAGAGLIANDFRYHLVDVYFSKPLSWWDYVLGKVMSLVFIGLGMTFVPACFLLLLHFLFVPKLDTLREIYWLPLPALAFSLVIVLPCALAVLASSSFFLSQRFAAITVFMLLVVNTAFGVIVAPLLQDESLFVIAFPAAISRLGESIFDISNVRIPDVSVFWSGVFWAVICIAALLVVVRKVRKAGVAA